MSGQIHPGIVIVSPRKGFFRAHFTDPNGVVLLTSSESSRMAEAWAWADHMRQNQ